GGGGRTCGGHDGGKGVERLEHGGQRSGRSPRPPPRSGCRPPNTPLWPTWSCRAASGRLPRVTTRSELALLARARPAMAAVLLSGRALRRPLVRVPGLGWVTSDPVVSREILK